MSILSNILSGIAGFFSGHSIDANMHTSPNDVSAMHTFGASNDMNSGFGHSAANISGMNDSIGISTGDISGISSAGVSSSVDTSSSSIGSISSSPF